MPSTPAPGAPLLSVPDLVWAEAAQREAVLRPLSDAPRLSRHAVETAARDLKLSPPRIYTPLAVLVYA